MYRRTLRRVQRGFTLLELLVVVAILAAIAGTATIALQDTDARAAAAAHVAMMDELNKGIRTFRVLQGNVLPNNWDSLQAVTTAGDLSTAALLPETDGDILGLADLGGATITGLGERLNEIGITSMQFINASTGATVPDGVAATGCEVANLQDTISDRGNAVVAGNIFLTPAANGCGQAIAIPDDGTTAIPIAVWFGGNERVLGVGAPEPEEATGGGIDVTASAENAKILMAVGAGPSSNLFDASELGGLTSVPVYRHVASNQYNRFIVLFHVANIGNDGTSNTLDIVDQVALAAIVDGAGDTKEEELGEWDGTRNTI